jgi:hypothetical protein
MDISRHFNVKVHIGAGVSVNQLFTIQFSPSESLTDMLEVLSKMGDFRYGITGNTVFLTKK